MHDDEQTPADRVRHRIRAWLDVTGVTLDQFVEATGLDNTKGWLEKIIQKSPAGRTDVRLRDLDHVARAMRTSASELVRSDEDRRTLELTPSEIRIVEQLRCLDSSDLAAIRRILDRMKKS